MKECHYSMSTSPVSARHLSLSDPMLPMVNDRSSELRLPSVCESIVEWRIKSRAKGLNPPFQPALRRPS